MKRLRRWTPPRDTAPLSATVNNFKETIDITLALVEDISATELDTTTRLVRGHCLVEVPGKDDHLTTSILEVLRPPDPTGLPDYVTSPFKHGCAILKQCRHIKKAHRVLSNMDPVRGALMRASAGQCDMDYVGCAASTMEDVTGLDHKVSTDKEGTSERSLFFAATLHSFGLPYEYARLETYVLQETSACYKAPLWDMAVRGSRAD